MKLRLISLAVASLFAGVLYAADTTTTRMGLVKPEEGSTGWGEKLRANYDIIDSSVAILSSTQTFTGGTTFSSATINSLRSDQVIVASATYSGNSSLYVRGSITGQQIEVGSTGMIGPPYINMSNGGVGTPMQIYHDGSVNGVMVLRALSGITTASPTDNSPVEFRARRIVAGPNYHSFGTKLFFPPDSSDSAFEYAVLIGTTTNDSVSKLLVLSSHTYSYSVSIGTVSTNNTPQYHLRVSTSGVTEFGGRARLKSYTLSQIQALADPVPVASDTVYCSNCTTDAVCVSTGGVNSFVRTSARSTACQ